METTKRKIDWWVPEVGKREIDAVTRVINTNYINEGNVTTDFEKRLSSLLNVKYVVATTSGTTALFLALKGLGIGYGDEVIVPDVTFIASANAVTLTGAKPVLVDVNPKTLNIDIDCIKKSLNERTKAIMPVHVSGRPADMIQINEIARENNLFVVEDSAEGFMSKYKGKYLGTIGDAGILSFSPNKTITTGQGGAVLTNNFELYSELKMLKDQGRPVRGTGGDDLHYKVGYNFKMTDLQAAVGISQLYYLNDRLERMKMTHKIYSEELKDLDGFNLLSFDIKKGEVPQWNDALVKKRESFCNYLDSKKIGYRKFWHPLHTQKPYKLSDETFLNSTTLSKEAMWLPSAFTLSDEDIKKVCTDIRIFFK